MKKFIPVLMLVFAFGLPKSCGAQDWEAYGGAQWFRGELSPSLGPFGVGHVNAVGWNGAISEYVTPWFGGTIDLSGSYSRPTITIPANFFGAGDPPNALKFSNQVNTSVYTYMAGPTFAYRRGKGRISPFGRVLVGAATALAKTTSKGTATLGFEVNTSETHFGLGVGGGADVRLRENLSWRVAADWILTTFPDFSNDTQNHFRLSTGLVLRF